MCGGFIGKAMLAFSFCFSGYLHLGSLMTSVYGSAKTFFQVLVFNLKLPPQFHFMLTHIPDFYRLPAENFPRIRARVPSTTVCAYSHLSPSSLKPASGISPRSSAKVKKITGEILPQGVIHEKLPQKVKNFEIRIRRGSRTGTRNMYKEYRVLSRIDAVRSPYQDMAARNRASFLVKPWGS
ncbi:putative 60S ribosomal protein L18A [Tuber indicum]|nr:putative 60S ribosomal protein L18A [Tuber indicum]